MSKILELIAKRKAELARTVAGIAISFGSDDILDLLPVSEPEDTLFLVEGSLLAHYCKQRVKLRSAEDALKAVFSNSKKQVCYKCKRLFRLCECKINWPWDGLLDSIRQV